MRPLIPLILATATAVAQDYGVDHRLKIPVSGDTRKGVLFIPNGVKKNEVLPLLVAIPDTRGKAFLELGQWQKFAYDERFAVFSVDVDTALAEGWHPSEQIKMQRDMEAVTEGIKVCFELAKEEGVELDPTGTVMTGFSGGTYLTLWLGLRRPDLFLGICGRSCVFFKETVERSKYDTVEPDYDMPIFLYHGELDAKRPRDCTNLAKTLLMEKGYKRVTHKVVPGMTHESKPEVFLEWYVALLKGSEKGRRESVKILEEVEKLREMEKAGRAGVLSKLVKLVARERKAGFGSHARTFLAEFQKEAEKMRAAANDLEADNRLLEAADQLREIDRKFSPLPISKEARAARAKLIRSDAYKARELLVKAKALIEDDKRDKAIPILEKLVEKYPTSVSAEEAQALLRG